MTNVVGCPAEAVHVGMPVEVAWEDVNAEVSLPVFTASDGSVRRAPEGPS